MDLNKLNKCSVDDISEKECILGKGSFGVVTKIRCPITVNCQGDQYVAAKYITAGDEEHINNMIKEKEILEKFDSDNIMKIYPTYNDDIQYFKFINGPELYDYCFTNRYELKLYKKNIVVGLCRGLEAIHKQRVLHCDIKPDNIVIDMNTIPHTPVYIDFGLAMQMEGKDYVLNKHGARAYILPNELFPEGRTAASDIYALMITLCESYYYPIRSHEMFRKDFIGKLKEEINFIRTIHNFSKDNNFIGESFGITLERIIKILYYKQDIIKTFQDICASLPDIDPITKSINIIDFQSPTWRERVGRFIRKHMGQKKEATAAEPAAESEEEEPEEEEPAAELEKVSKEDAFEEISKLMTAAGSDLESINIILYGGVIEKYLDTNPINIANLVKLYNYLINTYIKYNCYNIFDFFSLKKKKDVCYRIMAFLRRLKTYLKKKQLYEEASKNINKQGVNTNYGGKNTNKKRRLTKNRRTNKKRPLTKRRPTKKENQQKREDQQKEDI